MDQLPVHVCDVAAWTGARHLRRLGGSRSRIRRSRRISACPARATASRPPCRPSMPLPPSLPSAS
eukprot:1039306-Rhodomonas_salina.3